VFSIIWQVFWALVLIAVLVWIFRFAFGNRRGRHLGRYLNGTSSALEVLNERFAKGEIDTAEYAERKHALLAEDGK
jgi:uncharacterized membrane protein